MHKIITYIQLQYKGNEFHLKLHIYKCTGVDLVITFSFTL
jgi:hypothetical protein